MKERDKLAQIQDMIAKRVEELFSCLGSLPNWEVYENLSRVKKAGGLSVSKDEVNITLEAIHSMGYLIKKMELNGGVLFIISMDGMDYLDKHKNLEKPSLNSQGVETEEPDFNELEKMVEQLRDRVTVLIFEYKSLKDKYIKVARQLEKTAKGIEG